MSSSADQIAFSNSVDEQENTVLFQDKKWTQISDSSSNGGVFNGQLQFDLNTLSSQNQFTDLSEGYIQFPIRLTLRSTGTVSNTAAATAFTACIKNGFHQFVDSVQISIGNTTVQSSQIFQNVDTTFKMVSEWSAEEYAKFGPSLGLSLDDYISTFDSPTGLDNLPIAGVSPAFSGVQIPVAFNNGAKERARFLNSDTTATATASSILSTPHTLGKGRTQYASIVAATTPQDIFVQFVLATIRLKDVSDFIAKMPLIKQAKGFIYVNLNASKTDFTAAATGLPSAAPTSASLFGRCAPANLYGFTSTAGVSYSFTAEVSGVKSADLTTATPTMLSARLVAPYYVANPSVDRALSMKKKFRYNERFVTTLNIDAEGTYSGTLSPGITNPKRVTLYPYLRGSASGTAGIAAMSPNPLLSPWDSVPATTSPFAALSNLQITCGGKQMWQYPINMDYDAFLHETSQMGLDGSLNSQTTQSGVLDQRKWNQLHRFYTCDLSRRMGSDDGASKSVQLSCNNATKCPMTVIATIWYEREIILDTALGQVEQVM